MSYNHENHFVQTLNAVVSVMAENLIDPLK